MSIKSQKRQVVVIFDMSNIARRNFYVLGQQIKNGTVYGTLKSLFFIMREYPHAVFLSIWDGLHAQKYGKSINVDYKSNRKKQYEHNDKYFEQRTQLRKIIHKLGIPDLSFKEYEADFVIAWYTHLFKKFDSVVIVSNDKDFFQLLDSEHVSIFTKNEVMTKQRFCEIWKMEPSQWLRYRAIVGDPSDNIKGIPRIGKKRAIEFMEQYERLQDMSEEYQKIVRDNEKIMSLESELPARVYLNKCIKKLKQSTLFPLSDLMDLFTELQMHSLYIGFKNIYRILQRAEIRKFSLIKKYRLFLIRQVQHEKRNA